MERISFNIPGIHCESCIKLIRLSLDWTPWLQEFDLDADKKTLVAMIDENITTKEHIAEIIKEDAWYEVL